LELECYSYCSNKSGIADLDDFVIEAYNVCCYYIYKQECYLHVFVEYSVS